jgi:hypothetical protein
MSGDIVVFGSRRQRGGAVGTRTVKTQRNNPRNFRHGIIACDDFTI